MRGEGRSAGIALREALLIASAAGLGGVFLARVATDAAANHAAFQVVPGRVHAERLPSWIPPHWIAQARGTLATLAPGSVFDEANAALVAASLEDLAWVEAVESAESRFPRTLVLSIRARRPAAFVATEEGETPIDAGGIRLPEMPAETAAAFEALPRIVASTPFRPAPEAGRAWNDGRVVEGACVAREVAGFRAFGLGFNVREIDVSNVGGRGDPLASEVALSVEGGARVLWGRSSCAGSFGELSPEVKRAALGRIASEHPGLAGVRTVDVRFDRPVAVLGPPPDSSTLAAAR